MIRHRKKKQPKAPWCRYKRTKKKERKPIRKVSKRQAAQLREYLKIKEGWLGRPENLCCKVCIDLYLAQKLSKDEIRFTQDVHHSRGRLNTLLCATEFWIPVCERCHAWIHANIEKARKKGYLCQPGEWNKQP